MSTPIVTQIVAALMARLELIHVANGYHSEAGSLVVNGRLRPQDPQNQALTLGLWAGNESALEPRGRNRIEARLEVVVQAQVPLAADDVAGEVLEEVIADVQTAIERADARHLGGLAKDGITYTSRQATLPFEGARMAYAWLTYVVGYHRQYGDPHAQA